MNPHRLRDQARLLMLYRPHKPVQMRRLGKWLRRIAEETEKGLWPREGMVSSSYPRPGTAAWFITREIEGRAA